MKVPRTVMTDPIEVRVNLPKSELAAFCQRWRIAELAMFGSVLRDDFRPDSDIDVLVTFDSAANWGLLDHATMQEELAQVFGRDVDLVSRRAVEASDNWIRRRAILESAETVYAA
jgi:predicted nucleotidyltransferase